MYVRALSEDLSSVSGWREVRCSVEWIIHCGACQCSVQCIVVQRSALCSAVVQVTVGAIDSLSHTRVDLVLGQGGGQGCSVPQEAPQAAPAGGAAGTEGSHPGALLLLLLCCMHLRQDIL